MKIIITTGNKHKLEELNHYMQGTGVDFIPKSHEIKELQSFDEQLIVADKLMKAFEKFKQPVLVEHASLYIDILNGFPGGLTQTFWDTVQADRFCELFKNSPIKAKTTIGYCDGKRNFFFDGETQGVIADQPKGNRDFQWDCVFIPNGYSETYAELGNVKLDISMRKLAFDKFKKFLRENDV